MQPGVLWTYAEEAGNGHAFLALVGTPVIWSQIIALLGKHTLSLSRGCYRVGLKSVSLLAHDGLTLCLDTGECTTKAPSPLPDQARLFLIDPDTETAAMVFETEPGECNKSVSKEEAIELAIKALGDSEAVRNCVDQCKKVLERLTVGGLKTALQKTIRFGAAQVDLGSFKSNSGGTKVPTRIFAATCLALLFASPGTFVPGIAFHFPPSFLSLKNFRCTLEDAHRHLNALVLFS